LLYALLLPYLILTLFIVLILVIVSFQFHVAAPIGLFVLLIIAYLQWSKYHTTQLHESIEGSIPAGCYYRHSTYMDTFLNNFPTLKNYGDAIIQGKIPTKHIITTNNNNTPEPISFLSPTPWIFCGHLRTSLFPFLAFTPNSHSYLRRWVRVPMGHRLWLIVAILIILIMKL